MEEALNDFDISHFVKWEKSCDIGTSDLFTCYYCDKTFNFKCKIKRHIIASHLNIKNKLVCVICRSKFEKSILLKHFSTEHGISIKKHLLYFDSFEDFSKWKKLYEKENNSMYVKPRGSTTVKDGRNVYYDCHRNGTFHPKGKNLRCSKVKGSNKISGYCPSRMDVFVHNSGKIKLTFIDTHVGHSNELIRMNIPYDEKESIAAKLKANVPFKEVLKDIRESVTDGQLERIHLLTTKDLYNIERQFNIHKNALCHRNDSISIDGWVRQMSELKNNPVLFYKSSGIDDSNKLNLKNEDFILIISTKEQLQLLNLFGNELLCVDSTHKIKSYDFELHTLLVIDEFCQVLPCGFMFSNRVDIEIMSLFFEIIQTQMVTKIEPTIFMSDVSDCFYNAWCQVVSIPKESLFCSWHVDREWRINLSKIEDKDIREGIYQQLRSLMEERDKEAFQLSLQEFSSRMMNDFRITLFSDYFKSYEKSIQSWAYSYRSHSVVNKNSYLERMHSTIQYIFSQGRKFKGFDKLLNALMRFVRDHIFNRLIILNNGKLTSKISNIKKRHLIAVENGSSFVVNKQDNNSWKVFSKSGTEIGTVSEANLLCSCELKCSECRCCIHAYHCDCHDSAIRYNMCKHIHIVIQSLIKEIIPETEENAIILQFGQGDISIDQTSQENVIIVQELTVETLPWSSCPKPFNIEEAKNDLLKLYKEKIFDIITTEEQYNELKKYVPYLNGLMRAIENNGNS